MSTYIPLYCISIDTEKNVKTPYKKPIWKKDGVFLGFLIIATVTSLHSLLEGQKGSES